MSLLTRPDTTTSDQPTSDETASDRAASGGRRAAPRRGDDRPWTQRTVEAITRRLGDTRLGRRSFLTKTALVGSALAVDPLGFVLKPRTAWASVCGEDNECHEGWSAFCATINDGRNTCPAGSYPAGWWKIDNTTFCSGRARYIVDCNRRPGSSCNCRCADGQCDRRRVCCNNFRYGQCNTHIGGTTEVACRIVLCTPPWEWGNCTTTSLTSNGTRTHWSARLPSRTNPTPITVRWLDMGLAGSVLGDMVGNERGVEGGGRWARFQEGAMTKEPGTSATTVLLGPHARKYARLGGPNSVLGFPERHVTGNPAMARFEGGSTYRTGDGIVPLWGGMDVHYRYHGGPSGWMGRPADRAWSRGPWTWVQTESGWWVVRSDVEDRSRPLRSVHDMPSNGRFPPTVTVRRAYGTSGAATAAAISRRFHPSGTETVMIVRNGSTIHSRGAAAAAAHLDASILLTPGGALPHSSRAEIRRLGARRAIVVGPPGEISNSVVRQLQRLVDTVERWGGVNRSRSAQALSRGAFPDGAPAVVLVRDNDYPAAVAAGPHAHLLGGPVLVTGRNALPPATRQELARLDPYRAVILADRQAVTNRVERQLNDAFGLNTSRLSGSGRHAMSAHVARALGRTSDTMTVTSGYAYEIGLATAAWAATHRMPIVFADGTISRPVDREIRAHGPQKIFVTGREQDVFRTKLMDQLYGYRT